MATPKSPRPADLAAIVRALEQHPFGSLMLLLLVLATSLLVWLLR